MGACFSGTQTNQCNDPVHRVGVATGPAERHANRNAVHPVKESTAPSGSKNYQDQKTSCPKGNQPGVMNSIPEDKSMSEREKVYDSFPEKDGKPLGITSNEMLNQTKEDTVMWNSGSNATAQNGKVPAKKTVFQYKKGELIGSGSYGQVYQGLNLNTGQLLAVKTIIISGDPDKIQKEVAALREEIVLLKQLNHRNIVKYFYTELCEDMSGVDIILEYVPGGSIKSLLSKFGRLDERVTSLYAKQILEGLTYLHSHNIIHRDIKGANILIDTDGTIKLTDFGASKRIKKIENHDNPQDQNTDINRSLKGSPYWMAPEVANRTGHNSAADIWSVGCVVIEMLSGVPPWSTLTKNVKEVFQLITSGRTPPIPNNLTPTCMDFLSRTLRVDPKERPTALELLEHPFIKEPMNDSILFQTMTEIEGAPSFGGTNYNSQQNGTTPLRGMSGGGRGGPAPFFFGQSGTKRVKHADTLENINGFGQSIMRVESRDKNHPQGNNFPNPRNLNEIKEDNKENLKSSKQTEKGMPPLPVPGAVQDPPNPVVAGFNSSQTVSKEQVQRPGEQVISSKFATQMKEQKEREVKELQKARDEQRKLWEEELRKELEFLKTQQIEKGQNSIVGSIQDKFGGTGPQNPGILPNGGSINQNSLTNNQEMIEQQ